MSNWKMVMFLKEEIAPGIVIYENIENSYKDFIIDIEEVMSAKIENLKWNEPHILKDNENVIDYEIRNLQVFHCKYPNYDLKNIETPKDFFDKELGEKLYNFMHPIEEDYKSMYGVKTKTHDSYQLLKYGEGNFFTNHLDDDLKYPRTISIAWYINDDYLGGEINFPRFNISYKPKANSMLIFPSSYTYNHSVNKVYNGNRYAVVSWLE